MYVASQSTVCEWHQFQGLNEVIYCPYRQNFRACGGLRGNLITPSRTRPPVGARLLVPTHCSPPPSPTGPRRRRCHRVHVITVHAIPVCMVRVCARASRMCARAWMWLGWWAVAARADGPTPSWQLRQPTLWHCGRLSTSQQHAVVQRQQEAAMAQLHAQQPLGVNGPP